MTFDKSWQQEVTEFFGDASTANISGQTYSVTAQQTQYGLSDNRDEEGTQQVETCFFRFTLPDGVSGIRYGDTITHDGVTWTFIGVNTGIPPVIRVQASRVTNKVKGRGPR